MPRKKKSQEKNQEHHIDKTALIFAGFAIFVLAFASLGGAKSFRTERMEPQVLGQQEEKSGIAISEEINKDFIEEYMPYFTDDLHQTTSTSYITNSKVSKSTSYAVSASYSSSSFRQDCIPGVYTGVEGVGNCEIVDCDGEITVGSTVLTPHDLEGCGVAFPEDAPVPLTADQSSCLQNACLVPTSVADSIHTENQPTKNSNVWNRLRSLFDR